MKYTRQLFNSKLNIIISIFIIIISIFLFYKLFNWLFINSVYIGDANDCRNSSGACLAFIRQKARFILFGIYPYDQHLRPLVCLIIFTFCLFLPLIRPILFTQKRSLLYLIFVIFLIYFIMRGGFFGLKSVPIFMWSGLPLTLMLAFFGVLFSYPIGILLALGRASNFLFIKNFCIFYIEIIRGIPLISVLFIFAILFPLFLPTNIEIQSKILRAQIAIILFMSAYMAEVVRGGLASIDNGQIEAAKALGLSSFHITKSIILPQALKVVITPTINTAIGLFKDTSLVFILSLFDLLGTAKAALKDPNWQGFSMESYLFIALIYFLYCFFISLYSKKIEAKL